MTTYSVTLDDLDLALLPIRMHKNNDFLKKEYYQFKVCKKEPVEEPAPPILYTCHICAIDVPAAFASEHAASVKHRANARIASVAAQRTLALISGNPPPFADKHGRFCPNCSTIVEKNHNKTKEHRVAVMHDKLLNELMNAYIGEDKSSSEASCDSSDSEEFTNNRTSETRYDKDESDMKKEEYIELNSIKTNTKEVNIKTVEKQKKYDTSNKTNTKTNQDQNHNRVNISEIESDTESNHDNAKLTAQVEIKHLKIYKNENNAKGESVTKTNHDNAKLKPAQVEVKHLEINKKAETVTKTNHDNAKLKPTQAEVEHVQFVTKNNALVKVTSDQFHSFVKREDTIECIVCKTTLKSEEADSHMFSVKHLTLIPISMIDNNCVRKINDAYSHCLLCNQIVKTANVTKHTWTFSHGERKKQAVTGYTKKTFSLPKGTNACDYLMLPWMEYDRDHDTDEIMNQPKHNTEKVQNNPESHNANSITTRENVQKAENKEQDKTTVINNPSEETVIKANDIRQEAKDEKNKNRPSFSRDNNDNVYNVDWPVTYPYEVTEQESVVRCMICDCKVANIPDDRKDHLTGINHTQRVKTRRPLQPDTHIQPYGTGETLLSKRFVRCVICDVRVLNRPDWIEEHLTGNSHIFNAMQLEEDD